MSPQFHARLHKEEFLGLSCQRLSRMSTRKIDAVRIAMTIHSDWLPPDWDYLDPRKPGAGHPHEEKLSGRTIWCEQFTGPTALHSPLAASKMSGIGP